MTKEEIENEIEVAKEKLDYQERRKQGIVKWYNHKPICSVEIDKTYKHQLKIVDKFINTLTIKITKLKNQLKEMKNTEETQDQIPTKEELLAAGAKAYSMNEELFFFPIDGLIVDRIVLCLNIHTISIDKSDGSDIQALSNLHPSKENISNLYTMFTGKPLDFTVKEKDYSWEVVYERIEEQSPIIKSLDQIGFNTDIPDVLRKKFIALLKLHYIIEEMDEDFEHTRAHFVYYDCEESKLKHSGYGLEYPSGAIVIQSVMAAEKLIETNPQLLKDALGIVETEK